MASILPGYEYDIFISYRQKDNKYNGWVSEFVNNLSKELEATFKEEISIYFDENPHDGILETHNVDASLKKKLKCLVFIPVISQTYCDPKSFAWQNEFVAFKTMAANDSIGKDVMLANGNITCRILPIIIHEIDAGDKMLIENELEGPLRAIEFIYKSQGVNRSLRPDDLRSENMNHTYYRDQINKVANATKEIINGLKNPNVNRAKTLPGSYQAKSGFNRTIKLGIKTAIGIFVLAGLITSGYFLLSSPPGKSADNFEKSIAILPLKWPGNDPSLESISDFITQEIQSSLCKIEGLRIPAINSGSTQITIGELAKRLNVAYVLQGSVNRSGNKILVFAQLINGKNGEIIKPFDYSSANSIVDLHHIQSDLVEKIAENMNVVINPDVKMRIEKRSTENDEAYMLYNQASKEPLYREDARQNLEKAITLDSLYADAYALLASHWLYKGTVDLSGDSAIGHVEPLIKKSLQLDPNSFQAHLSKAILSMLYYWDFESVAREYLYCKQLLPSYSNVEAFFSDYLLAMGKFDQAFAYSKKAYDNNKISELNWIEMALAYYFNNENEIAYDKIEEALRLFPADNLVIFNFIRLSVYLEKYKMALQEFEKLNGDADPGKLPSISLGHAGIAYFATGNQNKTSVFLNELLRRGEKSEIGSPLFFAAEIYTAEKEYNKAIQTLEMSYARHEVELYWLKTEPLFRPLHDDPRFDNILKKIGFTE